MKIGIMSDLHMEFAPYDYVERDDVDLYINAGDIGTAVNPPNKYNWIKKYNKLFHIPGNHDFYQGVFTCDNPKVHMLNGLKIVGATLWTDLSQGLDWFNYWNGLVDSRFITGLNLNDYHFTFRKHRDFILKSDADIVVTHHGPSYKSVGPAYHNSPLNPAFVTELSEDILNMKKPPKIWIHGHVHSAHDYMIGDTRVICWPRGYPGENPWFQTYEPLIIEV